MIQTEPLALYHSWPIAETSERLRASSPALSNIGAGWLPDPGAPYADSLAEHGVGLWAYDLRNDTLRWSVGVFDLFGLPRERRASRPLAVSLYTSRSRRGMEDLRAHAIKHQRGFTLDIEIAKVSGEMRWLRLCAVAIVEQGRTIGLCGAKQDITHHSRDNAGRPLLRVI